MSRQSYRMGATDAELLFVDGFAGPGCYASGEDGSPVLAIKAVLDHTLSMPIPISFLFIEEDKERCKILEGKIGEVKPDIEKSRNIASYRVKRGDCEVILNSLFRERQERNEPIGPALFFLDQFGFADVSMELIARIMSKPLCEVFSYLNWDHMSRFLGDENKWPAIDKAYGGTQWKPALHIEHQKRATFMLQQYKMALKAKGNSKYVWQFAMCDDSDKLLYWLFFCTNNLRGLEEMKKAMSKVDRSGGFRFSDKDNPLQLHLFSGYSERALAGELTRRLGGEILTVGEIGEFVLTETPAYTFRTCLRFMEGDGRLRPINPPPHRRKGTFADKQMQIAFLPGTTA
jgi:three-Cys-motif partner protein